MRRHTRLIDRALKVARSSTYRWQHGAVVAKGNKILGHAPNKLRNVPPIDVNNVSDHAEQAVIRELLKIKDDLRGCAIYIARVNKAGNSTISRPCVDCMHAILRAGIKEIVYTNELGSYSIERVTN